MSDLPFQNLPATVYQSVLTLCKGDDLLSKSNGSEQQRRRLSSLLNIAILRESLDAKDALPQLPRKRKKDIERYIADLLSGEQPVSLAARSSADEITKPTYDEYLRNLVTAVLGPGWTTN